MWAHIYLLGCCVGYAQRSSFVSIKDVYVIYIGKLICTTIQLDKNIFVERKLAQVIASLLSK